MEISDQDLQRIFNSVKTFGYEETDESEENFGDLTLSLKINNNLRLVLSLCDFIGSCIYLEKELPGGLKITYQDNSTTLCLENEFDLFSVSLENGLVFFSAYREDVQAIIDSGIFKNLTEISGKKYSVEYDHTDLLSLQLSRFAGSEFLEEYFSGNNLIAKQVSSTYQFVDILLEEI